MSDAVLLVDYENVGRVDLARIPAGVRVPFFFGSSQKSVPTEFLKAALKLGERFIPIDIEGQGKNALDFHIAFYLGEYLAASPAAACIILSKDKGFDPLIKHLSGRKFLVRRAATLEEAFPAARTSPRSKAPASKAAPVQPRQSDALTEALQWLIATPKNRRPRKLAGLVAHLFNHFGKKIPEERIRLFVDELIATRQISETKGAVTYNF